MEEKNSLEKQLQMFEEQYKELSEIYDNEKSIFIEREEKIEQLKENLKVTTQKVNDNEQMFEYLLDLNKINFVYHSATNDSIDSLLGKIINNTARFNFERGNEVLSKAKMLFVRESEGVYTYCGKKVIMKIENDRIVIRVGGGFMSLE